MSSHQRSLAVLIVDDDGDIIELLREALSEYCTVDSVCDSASALALLEHGRPRVTILDHHLPSGGFADVLAKAKEVGSGIVVMSGDSALMAELSAFDYPCLSKPFRIANLLSAIDIASARAGA